MNKRNALLLFIAFGIAAFTAMAVRSRMQQADPGNPAVVQETARILIAQRDLPAGSFVQTSRDLEWTTIKSENLQPNQIREGIDSIATFEGSVARRMIRAGEPVTASALIKPGAGGFLSAVLEPGTRAVSIAVDATSGNAGFIFPGDRVDLIVGHKVGVTPNPSGEKDEAMVSETFVHDVRVVAVDQQLDAPDNKAVVAKTVTVEVSPKQAEKIVVATEIGKVSLVLRSMMNEEPKQKAEGEAEPEGFLQTLDNGEPARSYTSDRELSSVLSRDGSSSSRVQVIHGKERETYEFLRNPQ